MRSLPNDCKKKNMLSNEGSNSFDKIRLLPDKCLRAPTNTLFKQGNRLLLDCTILALLDKSEKFYMRTIFNRT